MPMNDYPPGDPRNPTPLQRIVGGIIGLAFCGLMAAWFIFGLVLLRRDILQALGVKE